MAMRAGESWRQFRAAAWLGWQVESNWTDPFVFSVYALAKPLATAGILTAIYFVVAGGGAADARFLWMYVGNAFFVYVSILLVGVAWTVVEDREMYQMLKYVYASPVNLLNYLAGRSITKLGLSTFAAAVVLGVGALFLGLRYDGGRLAYAASALGLGILGVFALGLVLAGLGLVFARHSVNLNEAAATVFYLLCGVIFPVDLLPPGLRELGLALPMTWWLEAMRWGLGAEAAVGLPGSLGAGWVWAGCAASAVAWYAFAVWAYRRLERRAKRLGLLDQTTNF